MSRGPGLVTAAGPLEECRSDEPFHLREIIAGDLIAISEGPDYWLGYTESAGIGLTDAGVDDDEFIHTDCLQTKIQLFHDMAYGHCVPSVLFRCPTLTKTSFGSMSKVGCKSMF